MKKLLIFLLPFLFIPVLNAQTLHTYIFCAENDAIIGEGAKVNLQRIERIIEDIREKAGVQVKNNYGRMSVADIEKHLENIKTTNYTSKDIILFYYSGHGTNTVSPNEYPNFMIGGRGTKFNLQDIHFQLKKTQANVILTLADCCNYNGKEVVSAGKAGSSRNDDTPPKKHKDPDIPARYKKLFRGEKIDILACSSEKNQLSVYNKDFGGFFTSSFDIALFKTLNREEEEKMVTWKAVFENASEMTIATAREFGKEQKPKFEFKVEPKNPVAESDMNKKPAYVINWEDKKINPKDAEYSAPSNKEEEAKITKADSGRNMPFRETIVSAERLKELSLPEIEFRKKMGSDYEMSYLNVLTGSLLSALIMIPLLKEENATVEDLIKWNQYRLMKDEKESGKILFDKELIIYKKKSP